MKKFNISSIKLCTEIEGPFKRCCIWFQGCDILCDGCCNKSLQDLVPNHIVDEDKLLEIIKSARDEFGIEGITLSGGEPSLQKNLVDFNNKIHEMGLGIIMFSGHYKNDLDVNLVNSVDLLIAGPYMKDKNDTKRILIGSTNKELNFITDRYKEYENYFYQDIAKEEVSIDNDNIFINGD